MKKRVPMYMGKGGVCKATSRENRPLVAPKEETSQRVKGNYESQGKKNLEVWKA